METCQYCQKNAKKCQNVKKDVKKHQEMSIEVKKTEIVKDYKRNDEKYEQFVIRISSRGQNQFSKVSKVSRKCQEMSEVLTPMYLR